MDERIDAPCEIAGDPALAALVFDARPAFLVGSEQGRLLWANAAGFDAIGAGDADAALGRSFGLDRIGRASLLRLRREGVAVGGRLLCLRFVHAPWRDAAIFAARCLRLRSGRVAVLLVSVEARLRPWSFQGVPPAKARPAQQAVGGKARAPGGAPRLGGTLGHARAIALPRPAGAEAVAATRLPAAPSPSPGTGRAVPLVSRAFADAARGGAILLQDASPAAISHCDAVSIPDRENRAGTGSVCDGACSERREESASKASNVVALPAAAREGTEPPPLTPPERDAFRQIAAALGARLESDCRAPVGLLPGPDKPACATAAAPLSQPSAGAARAAGLDPRTIERLSFALAILSGERIALASRGFLDLLGYDDLDDLAAAGGAEAIFAGAHALATWSRGGGAQAVPALHRDGRVLPVEARLTAAALDGKPASALALLPLSGSSDDLADRLAATERRADELQARLDAAQDELRAARRAREPPQAAASEPKPAPADPRMPVFEPIDLDALGAACLEAVRGAARSGRVVLRMGLSAAAAPRVLAHRASLHRAVFDLLSETVAETPAGGQVILSTARLHDGGAVLSVRQTGSGRTASAGPARGAQRPDCARYPGSGGRQAILSSIQALVEASGAALHVEPAFGRGTLIELRFPPDRVVPA